MFEYIFFILILFLFFAKGCVINKIKIKSRTTFEYVFFTLVLFLFYFNVNLILHLFTFQTPIKL